ncbi:LysR Transcriptional regulator [Burkholderiaceae bacterium]|jgi:DNA-binding transcriptional LysR family regulator
MSSIRVLKNFLAVTRHPSVAAAAREIGLTPAAAGQQLAQLEEELGISLFDRNKRSLVLNNQGRALIEPIQEIISRYESLGSQFKSGLSGSLTVGALVSTLMGQFGKTLEQLKRQYPELEIKISTGLSSDFLQQVMDGILDAAIVAESPYALPKNVQWTFLYEEQMIFIYPKGKDRTALPFIRFEPRTWTGELVDQVIRSNQLEIENSIVVNSVEAIIELVRQGLGYAIVPKLANVQWDKDKQIVTKNPLRKAIYRRVGLLERKNHGRKKITQAIEDHFRKAKKGSRPSAIQR